MAKKAAIGCLSVFVLLLVAGGASLWWFVARPAAAAVSAFEDLGRLQEIRAGVRTDGPYAAPESGVLQAAQVDRYLAVQDAMGAALEGRVATLSERYEALDASGREPGPVELARAASDVSRLLVDAVRAQVDALNEQDFSLDEYASVRSRVLAAAGMAVPGYDLTHLLAADADIEVGADASPDAAPAGRVTAAAVPPENVELVDPHRERLERALPFAHFGL